MAYVKPSTLAGLLRDTGAIVPRLISLKALLPDADVSTLAAARPELLLLVRALSLQAGLLARLHPAPPPLDSSSFVRTWGRSRRRSPQ